MIAVQFFHLCCCIFYSDSKTILFWQSSTSDIIFAEGAEEVDELFRDIAILEGRLIDLIQVVNCKCMFFTTAHHNHPGTMISLNP
jgi:hypothetical protein